MMRIALLVKYADGREQAVIVSAPDLIAFERQYDKPTSAVGTTGRLEYVYFCAWHALKRLGLASVDFDEWLTTIESVIDDTDAEVEIAPLAK